MPTYRRQKNNVGTQFLPDAVLEAVRLPTLLLPARTNPDMRSLIEDLPDYSPPARLRRGPSASVNHEIRPANVRPRPRPDFSLTGCPSGLLTDSPSRSH